MANDRSLAALAAAAVDALPSDQTLLLPIGQAGSNHRRRFDEYVRDLRRAKKGAEKWWADLIETEMARVGNEQHAEINVRTRRPSGPAVDPAVIRVIRAAWLDCQALNDSTPETLRVAPVALVGLWLDESGYEDLVRFVASLHFWPVGLSDEGRWE